MANSWIKATKVVNAGLGVLFRETLLPQLVWRDAGGSFKGVLSDTISIRVPAFTTARTRTLRNHDAVISIDELTETKVDVTLATDVYKGVNITDEDMTLDIADFQEQVSNPVLRAIVIGVEDELADTITGATYQHEVDFNTSDPYSSILEARKKLNDSHVPASQRALVCGSEVEQYILESLKDASSAGSDTALREATIGRFGGFTIVQHNSIPPDEAYAFHKTAFVLSTQAPLVPQGATWGAAQTYQGFALRLIRDYDPTYLRDRFIGNVYVGSNATRDYGEFDDDGIWTPDSAPDVDSDTPLLIRAVKLSIGS